MDHVCGMCENINPDRRLSGSYVDFYCNKKGQYVDIRYGLRDCYNFSLNKGACASCQDLDWRNQESYATRFRCEGISQYVDPFDKRYYCNHDKNRGSDTSCYITTMICNILGYSDDCELLNLLRMFRENVLKCDFQYFDILLEYDLVGPIISQNLYAKEDNYKFSLQIVKNFLSPCASAIKEGFVSEAVKIYKNMVNYLCDVFNIELISPSKNTSYDYQTLGKGRKRSFYF